MQRRLGPYVCLFPVLDLDGRINDSGVFIVCVELLICSSVSTIHCSQDNFCRRIFFVSAVEQSKPGRPASTYKLLPFRLREGRPTRSRTAVVNNQLALMHLVGHLGR